MTQRATLVGLLAVASVVAAGVAAAVVARAWMRPAAIEQPVAFSHRSHIEGEGLECLECHADAAKSPGAGLPDIRDCYECHKSAQTDDPNEDEAVRTYAREQRQIPVVQVNRNVVHVYFSHRMHVATADMACDACHAGYAEREEPTAHPNPDLHSMRLCMDCHQREGASNECVVCHK